MTSSEQHQLRQLINQAVRERIAQLPPEQRDCEHCGTQLTPGPQHKRFCSTQCRRRHTDYVYRRNRYQTDPLYREQIIERKRRWRAQQKEAA